MVLNDCAVQLEYKIETERRHSINNKEILSISSTSTVFEPEFSLERMCKEVVSRDGCITLLIAELK